eukprot:gene9060-9999_t
MERYFRPLLSTGSEEWRRIVPIPQNDEAMLTNESNAQDSSITSLINYNNLSEKWNKRDEKDYHDNKDNNNMVASPSQPAMLALFMGMIFAGLGNKVFNKLMTIPMYHYPLFLNLLTTFVYLPFTAAYALLASRQARSDPTPTASSNFMNFPLSTRILAFLGALDAIATALQTFSMTYLPGGWTVLLGQMTLPVTMIFSKYLLRKKYEKAHYLGAVLVTVGVICVVLPAFVSDGGIGETGSGGNMAMWSIILLLSAIPHSLSSVIKEKYLAETANIDPIYFNGWVAIFQIIFALVLTVPSAYLADPPVPMTDLPLNLWQGLQCYFGISSFTCADDDDGSCTPDSCNPDSPIFVNLYLLFNQTNSAIAILWLKFGSASGFYLAHTLLVPLGNMVFLLPFLPQSEGWQWSEGLSLAVISLGLVFYYNLVSFSCPLDSFNNGLQSLLSGSQILDRKEVEEDEYKALLQHDVILDSNRLLS